MPGILIENNCNYTKMLAEWTLQHGIRFVYASSAATYGALEGRVSEDLDITSLRPLNMYGYSKQLFDLHAATRGYFDRIVGLKYFNVFGPNEDHKGDMRSVVNKAFSRFWRPGACGCSRATGPSSPTASSGGTFSTSRTPST